MLTIAKARTLLGKKAERLNDQQITDLINLFSNACDNAIENTIKKRLKVNTNPDEN